MKMHTEIYISEVDVKTEPFVYHEIRLKKNSEILIKYFCFKTNLRLKLELNARALIGIGLLFFGFVFEIRNFRKHLSDLKGLYLSIFYVIDDSLQDAEKINIHFVGKRLIFAWIKFGGRKIRVVCHANDCYSITPLNLFILKRVNEINVISNYAKGQLDLQLKYNKEVRLIRNSFSGQVLSNIMHTVETNNMLKLCYFGRFVPMKGLDLFVNEIARKGGFKITIDLYGKKSDFLERVLLNLDIENINLNYCGYVEPDLVVDIMKNYDSLLLPARVVKNASGIVDLDGIPTVFQEAMQAGIPVITNDVGGIEEVIWHGLNGIIMSRLNNIKELQEIAEIKKRMNNQIWLDYFSRMNTLSDFKYDFSSNR